MPEAPKRTTRRIESHDPSLSPEANDLLTNELQEVIGADTADVPAGRTDPAGDRHATHTPFIANVIDVRLALVITGLVALFTLGVVAINFGTALVLVGVILALIAAVALLVWMTNRMTSEREHVAPETAAALEAEGVGDPDRVLNDLVNEYTSESAPGDEHPS